MIVVRLPISDIGRNFIEDGTIIESFPPTTA